MPRDAMKTVTCVGGPCAGRVMQIAATFARGDEVKVAVRPLEGAVLGFDPFAGPIASAEYSCSSYRVDHWREDRADLWLLRHASVPQGRVLGHLLQSYTDQAERARRVAGEL